MGITGTVAAMLAWARSARQDRTGTARAKVFAVTIANLITMARALAVPVVIWALLSRNMPLAFALFMLAGLSDAVDGAVARYLDQQSELGAWLDPLADKALLMSVFVVLAYLGELPLWLAILVVSRDLLILCGVVLLFLLGGGVEIRPLWVSKANTTAQIVLAGAAMATLAFGSAWPFTLSALVWVTGGLTLASALAYVVQGLRLLGGDAAPAAGE